MRSDQFNNVLRRWVAILVLASVPLATPLPSFGQQARLDADAVYAVALVDILPSEGERGAAVLSRYVAETRAEQGLVRLDLVRQPAPLADHFALLAVWRSPSDRQAHLEHAFARRFREELHPLVASPVDDRIYTAVPSAG